MTDKLQIVFEDQSGNVVIGEMSRVVLLNGVYRRLPDDIILNIKLGNPSFIKILGLQER